MFSTDSSLHPKNTHMGQNNASTSLFSKSLFMHFVEFYFWYWHGLIASFGHWPVIIMYFVDQKNAKNHFYIVITKVQDLKRKTHFSCELIQSLVFISEFVVELHNCIKSLLLWLTCCRCCVVVVCNNSKQQNLLLRSIYWQLTYMDGLNLRAMTSCYIEFLPILLSNSSHKLQRSCCRFSRFMP